MTMEKQHGKRKKYNKYDLSGEYGIGWASNTNEEFYFDLEDYDKIKNICWFVSSHSSTKILTGRDINSNKMVRMHTILGFSNYDHIDQNELNNRKNNLRPCTHMENCQNRRKRSDNTSGIIGVYFIKHSEKWTARISINGKSKNLGTFVDKEDAVKARLAAELKYYGNFAPQRHLFEKYGVKADEI